MLHAELENNLSNTSYVATNSSEEYLQVFTTTEDVILKVLYVLISAIGIIGNAVVIFIIGKDKRIQNTVNLLILNLSLSDIVTGIAIYPYLFIKISADDYANDRADMLCALKSGLIPFFAATTVNFMTLGVLSLSRYMLINHPTKVKWRIRKSHVRRISIVTWVIGMAIVAPNTVAFRYVPSTGRCEGYWPAWFNKSVYFSMTVLVFSVPIASLIFTFASTVYTLWFKASTRRLTRANSVSGVRSSRKKVTILLGALILAFLLSWLPFAVTWVLSAATSFFTASGEDAVKKLRLLHICTLIASSNTCMDPIIYALGNRQIKEGAKTTLRKGHANNVEPTNTGYE